MKAPNKIYLHGYSFDDEPCKAWEREPRVKGMRGYPAEHAEYIRKDALLEWAKEMMCQCEELKDKGYGDVYYGSQICAFETMIKKLNSL